MKLLLHNKTPRPFSTIYLYKQILRTPKSILSLCVVLFIVFLFFASKLPIDTNSESLMLENDKDFKIYESILKNYSTKEFLILAFSAKDGDVFSKDSLATLQDIHADLSKHTKLKPTRSPKTHSNPTSWRGR